MTKYSIRSLGSETCKVSGLEILCRCWIWEWENDTSECCYINCCLFGDVLGPTSSSCPPALYSQYQRLIHILCIMATHLLWGLNRISTWSSRLFSGLSISTSVTGWEYRVVREAQAPSSSPTPTSGSSAVSAVTQTQVSRTNVKSLLTAIFFSSWNLRHGEVQRCVQPLPRLLRLQQPAGLPEDQSHHPQCLQQPEHQPPVGPGKSPYWRRKTDRYQLREHQQTQRGTQVKMLSV